MMTDAQKRAELEKTLLQLSSTHFDCMFVIKGGYLGRQLVFTTNIIAREAATLAVVFIKVFARSSFTAFNLRKPEDKGDFLAFLSQMAAQYVAAVERDPELSIVVIADNREKVIDSDGPRAFKPPMTEEEEARWRGHRGTWIRALHV